MERTPTGRHPDAVRYTTSAEEDVRRRDFTINGLLLDPDRLFPQGLKPHSLTGTDVRAKARTLQEAGDSLEDRGKATAGPSTRPSPGEGLAQDDNFRWSGEQLRGAVMDYVGGVADLEAGIVRAIGRPEMRFEEDRLRMMRAVRFAARFGFALDPATQAAIRALAPRIAAVSRERVRDELTKMLTEGKGAAGVRAAG